MTLAGSRRSRFVWMLYGIGFLQGLPLGLCVLVPDEFYAERCFVPVSLLQAVLPRKANRRRAGTGELPAGLLASTPAFRQWLCTGNAQAAAARVNAGDCSSIMLGKIRITPSILLITPVPEPNGLDGTEVRGSGKS